MSSLVSLIQGLASQNLDVLKYTKAVLSKCPADEQVDANGVERIILADGTLNAGLPAEAEKKQEIYRTVASQVRLLRQIGDSGLINDASDIIQQGQDDPAQAVVGILDLLRQRHGEVLPAAEEFGNDLLESKTGTELIKELGLTPQDLYKITRGEIDLDLLKKGLPVLQSVLGLIADNPDMEKHIKKAGLTPKELKEISKGKIPPEIGKKIFVLLQNEEVIKFLEQAGASPMLLKLLPLLIKDDSGSNVIEDVVGEVLENSEVQGLLGAFGIELPKKVAPPPPSPSGKGWANGYGTWIVGGGSAVLGVIGFFVEDNVIKSVLIALGALGVGGSVIGSFEAPRKMLGSAN